jgi:mannose-6-phosphate isomerase
MRIVNKPWGREEIWAEVNGKYLGKFLVIAPGKRLSLQHHEEKDETICVMSGVLTIEVRDPIRMVGTLFPGDVMRITPGTRHRFSALDTEVRLAEVSTYHPDDVVRHEDDHGRA